MATKTKRKPPKKASKRGPKEERLVITDDPEKALAELLKPKTPPKKR